MRFRLLAVLPSPLPAFRLRLQPDPDQRRTGERRLSEVLNQLQAAARPGPKSGSIVQGYAPTNARC